MRGIAQHFRIVGADDGSSYYSDHDNVIVGGWLHKNFLASPGHKHTYNTLGLFSPSGMHDSGPGYKNLDPQNYESLTNSTILMPGGGEYLVVPTCVLDVDGFIRTGGNTIYTGSNVSANNVTIVCGGKKDPEPQQRTFTLEGWQQAGHDDGTKLVPPRAEPDSSRRRNCFPQEQNTTPPHSTETET